MKNTFLYTLTVLIWGSTWFAMEFQLGDVPIAVSLIYRFTIAAGLMWSYCLIAKIQMRLATKTHFFIVILALGNFSLNYAVLYWAQEYLTSAIASTAFSITLLLNIINTRLFFGIKIQPRVYIGAIFGILGIVALFWNDVIDLDLSSTSLTGLFLVLVGALLASLGNMASARNARQNIDVFAVNAWGMFYAVILLTAFAVISDLEFVFPTQASYVISLIYLSVFGTVIAFATYYVLLRDMGPDKASYVIVLFPVVAVIISSLFEGFIWTPNIFIGFTLVLLGNAILLTPRGKVEWLCKVIRNDR